MYTRREWPAELKPAASRHVLSLCEFAGRRCVVKEYRLDDPSERRAVIREAQLLRQLAHPSIVRPEAVFSEEVRRAVCCQSAKVTGLAQKNGGCTIL